MTFSQERVQQVNYWVINGKIDLPERNIVNVTMYLDNHLVPESEKMLYVNKGRFVYKLPVVKRALPGNYEIKLIYKKDNKRHTQIQKEYIGDPGTEAIYRKEYSLFFRNFIEEVMAFDEYVKQQTTDYLKENPVLNQKKIDELTNWGKGLEKRFAELQKNLAKYSIQRILIPYSYESIKKAKIALVYSNSLLNSAEQKVLLHFQLSKKNDKILSERREKIYIDNIKNLLETIKKNEQFAEYLNENSIRGDLQWVSSVYSNFSQVYVKSQEKFSKKLWEGKRDDFAAQMKNLTQRVKDYEESFFIKKHPKILKNFKQLLSLLLEVSDAYTRDLYDKARISLPPQVTITKDTNEIQNAIKDTSFAIFDTLQGLMSEEEKERRKLLKQMENTLVTVSRMQQEMQKEYMSFFEMRQEGKADDKKFNSWHSSWQRKVKELTKDVHKILTLQRTHNIKGIPVSWYFFVKYLNTIDFNYKKIMDMKQDPGIVVAINRNHGQIQKMINNIRVAIAKEK